MQLLEALAELKEDSIPVHVLGLARSGMAAVRYLCGQRYSVIAADEREVSPEKRAELEALGVTIVDAKPFAELPAEKKFCVLSPGVPLSVAEELRFENITNELELALLLLPNKSLVVTGTSGKSTTVALIQHIFSGVGQPSRLLGNIGSALLDSVSKIQPDEILVVEASSYQLESSSEFQADVAVFTNFSENHLDRHGNLENYFRAKARLFERLSAKAKAFLGPDLPQLETQAEVHFLKKETTLDYLKQNLELLGFSLDLSRSALLGEHNYQNFAAAALGCSALVELSEEQLVSAAKSFKALPHRLESFLHSSGALCVNDSKATTPAAVRTALKAIKPLLYERDLSLLIGGELKPGSWEVLRKGLSLIESYSLYLFGAGAEALLKEFPESRARFDTLEQALDVLSPRLSEADLLLLSPGAASFDEFGNFELRGDRFKKRLSES